MDDWRRKKEKILSPSFRCMHRNTLSSKTPLLTWSFPPLHPFHLADGRVFHLVPWLEIFSVLFCQKNLKKKKSGGGKGRRNLIRPSAGLGRLSFLSAILFLRRTATTVLWVLLLVRLDCVLLFADPSHRHMDVPTPPQAGQSFIF